jgi:hypothetical protein
MNRRRFLAAAAGGLVSPGLARGQSTSVALIGFLNGFSRQEWADPIAAFHNGLGEAGFAGPSGAGEGYQTTVTGREETARAATSTASKSRCRFPPNYSVTATSRASA